ncbi:MAG: hypothetical protein GY869_32490, partial [Planctomycetes bacterium]|nr:hypothetical protein [Planctomycetota bacterium]
MFGTNVFGQAPPGELSAVFDPDSSTVTLNWDPPDNSISEWIHWDGIWDEGYKIGLVNGGTFYTAARFDAEDMAPYVGFQLTHIRIVIWGLEATYTAQVWQGGDGSGPDELIHTQPITGFNIGTWTDVELETPITIIADTEYWFGYEVYHFSGQEYYPAGADDGPMIVEKGGWISLDEGQSWGQLASYGENRNWNIQGLVQTFGAVPRFDPKIERQMFILNSSRTVISGRLGAVSQPGSCIPDTRDTEYLTGYNIYRAIGTNQFPDDPYLTIDDTLAVSYVDSDDFQLDTFYYYAMTAIYDDGQSDFSNIDSVYIPIPGLIELAYDDGSTSTNFNGFAIGEDGGGACLKFISPSLNEVSLIEARFFMDAFQDGLEHFVPFELHVYTMAAGIPDQDLIQPFEVDVDVDVEPETWLDVDLTSYDIVIPAGGTFFVGFIEGAEYNGFGFDDTPPHYNQAWA